MMLRENELRIGNIVISPERRYEIISLGNFQKLVNNISAYEPVAITEHILLSSGFVRSKKNNFYRLNQVEDYYLIFTGKIGMMYKVDRGSIGVPIRFIHELQNAYYYLSGKEIELNVEVGKDLIA